MTDLELLQFASKAFYNSLPWHISKHFCLDDNGVIQDWNPLHHLGQARGLRHALHMTTKADDQYAYAICETQELPINQVRQSFVEAGGKRAAKRRAIVIAAANIGKTMP